MYKRQTEGSVIVVAENGEEIEAVISTAKSRARMASRQAIVQADGSIVIDLGTQIAVKKVTIKVTGTSSTVSYTHLEVFLQIMRFMLIEMMM